MGGLYVNLIFSVQLVTTLCADILLCVPEEGLQLQTEIVGLCEAWWRADLPDRERLVPHTVSFLLASSLYGTATVSLGVPTTQNCTTTESL